jgi:16S rRNA (cytidine1402-2'-O)-methyltransferase
VATPIGNLDDLSARATDTLRQVDLIAAEDTRRTRVILRHCAISTPLVSLHEHNERRVSEQLLQQLREGDSIALVSDAGTPLINDPGLPLVRAARASGVRVVPIPGACAFVTALSASGLATDRFCFEGFPPRSKAARLRYFKTLLGEARTLIFYESSHRVHATVRDLASVFDPSRKLVIARELTKLHETILSLPLDQAQTAFDDENMLKGEFVLLLEGAEPISQKTASLDADQERVLSLLLEDCSVKTASSLAARITGGSREAFYRRALELAAQSEPAE